MNIMKDCIHKLLQYFPRRNNYILIPTHSNRFLEFDHYMHRFIVFEYEKSMPENSWKCMPYEFRA